MAQSLIAGYGLGANQHEFGALAPMLAVMIVPAARATTLAEGVPE